MMKQNMMKPTHTFKPLSLAMALVIGISATSALAEDAMNVDMQTATYSNDWKTSAAIEFDRLDTTGNGLLLPHEASKGKAFNKKSFAAADADRDGYIDINEYVYHKTGKWPEAAQPVNMGATDNSTGGNALMSEEPVIMADAQTTANNEASDDANKRSVGVVIDDSVITTKAKAKILATKDLKTLQISVETREGEVTLSGSVDNEAAKMKAEQVVSEIEGVKSVKNGLEVKG
jgi:osmotically-inducible protein OsmY